MEQFLHLKMWFCSLFNWNVVAVSHPSTNRARHCLTSVIDCKVTLLMRYVAARSKVAFILNHYTTSYVLGHLGL